MTPPRFSTWLLFALGSGDDLETIAGDLAERLPSRSPGWYRRQVARAIVITGARHLLAHYVLTLRAIVVGGTAIVASGWLALRLAYWVMPLLLPPPISPNSLPVIILTLGVPAALSTCIVSRLHGPYGAPFSMAFTMVTVLLLVLPRLLFLVRNALVDERFVPYLLGAITQLPVVVSVVLLGALVGTLACRIEPVGYRPLTRAR